MTRITKTISARLHLHQYYLIPALPFTCISCSLEWGCTACGEGAQPLDALLSAFKRPQLEIGSRRIYRGNVILNEMFVTFKVTVI